MARIIFMGSPEIAVPSLQALVEAGYQIPLVVTQPDKPKGRGRRLQAPPVKAAAQDLGLKVLQPERVKTPEFVQTLKDQRAEGIAVVAYGRILSKEVIEVTPWGGINVHFSLLPKYRGASCVAYALINGDDVTGTTTMLMDEGMDTGPILMQWTEPIRPDDTAGSLSARLAPLGAQQLVKTLQGLEKGVLRPVPQEDSKARLAPLLKKEMGHVDWNQKARKVFNLYRGLTPWPGVFGFLGGRRVILTQMKFLGTPATASPGSLSIDSEDKLSIHCQDQQLGILQLKPEGKKILSAAEFVRGLRNRKGLKLK